jgi:hypothetical protein
MESSGVAIDDPPTPNKPVRIPIVAPASAYTHHMAATDLASVLSGETTATHAQSPEEYRPLRTESRAGFRAWRPIVCQRAPGQLYRGPI